MPDKILKLLESKLPKSSWWIMEFTLYEHVKKIGESLRLVGETEDICSIGMFWEARSEWLVPESEIADLLGAESADLWRELTEVGRAIRSSITTGTTLPVELVATSRASVKTVLLAALIPRIIALRLHDLNNDLAHEIQMALWHSLQGGSALLHMAAGQMLAKRGDAQEWALRASSVYRKPGERSQHRECYKCRHIYHFREFVNMCGQPYRQSTLCRQCYERYETQRLDDILTFETKYRDFYYKYCSEGWMGSANPNQLLLLSYLERSDCIYCSKKLPNFSYAERRRLRRDRVTTSFAEPWQPTEDGRDGIELGGAEPDYLHYPEHGGSRNYSNIVWACYECKMNRGSTPLSEWFSTLGDQRLRVDFLHIERFGCPVGNSPEINTKQLATSEQWAIVENGLHSGFSDSHQKLPNASSPFEIWKSLGKQHAQELFSHNCECLGLNRETVTELSKILNALSSLRWRTNDF